MVKERSIVNNKVYIYVNIYVNNGVKMLNQLPWMPGLHSGQLQKDIVRMPV